MTHDGFGPIPSQPLGYVSAEVDPRFVKSRTGGIVFGIIAIVIGGSSGCLGLLLPLSLLAPQQQNQKPGTIVGALLLYLIVAVALIWLGIGAIKMRRWVRPLVLTLGTLTIVIGVISLIAMGFFFPAMAKVAPGNAGPGLPPGFFSIVMAGTMVVMGLLLLIIPGAFVWFYRKREVKEALEHFDPVERWTDRCPIPVLGIVVALIGYGGMILVSAPQAMLPVFGTVLYGPVAMAVAIVFAIAALVLAWLSFRRRPAGWWGTIAFVVFLAVAYLMTAARSDQRNLYRNSGFTAQQLEVMNQFRSRLPFGLLGLQLPIPLLMIGYMIWVRKYFGDVEATGATRSGSLG
jgi:hypothetical protein